MIQMILGKVTTDDFRASQSLPKPFRAGLDEVQHHFCIPKKGPF